MTFIKDLIGYALVILIVIALQFIISPIEVVGESMAPNLDDGEIMIMLKVDLNISREDIIIFNYNDKYLIKRVIGLPGETLEIKDGDIIINGEIYDESYLEGITTADFDFDRTGVATVPEGTYFVLGDNRTNSIDSRTIGFINEEDIIGEAIIVLFPFNKFGFVK